MNKITLIKEDGTIEDFFPQSYTDAAVAAAIAAIPASAPDKIAEVDVIEADGTTEKFIPQ